MRSVRQDERAGNRHGAIRERDFFLPQFDSPRTPFLGACPRELRRLTLRVESKGYRGLDRVGDEHRRAGEETCGRSREKHAHPSCLEINELKSAETHLNRGPNKHKMTGLNFVSADVVLRLDGREAAESEGPLGRPFFHLAGKDTVFQFASEQSGVRLVGDFKAHRGRFDGHLLQGAPLLKEQRGIVDAGNFPILFFEMKLKVYVILALLESASPIPSQRFVRTAQSQRGEQSR